MECLTASAQTACLLADPSDHREEGFLSVSADLMEAALMASRRGAMAASASEQLHAAPLMASCNQP